MITMFFYSTNAKAMNTVNATNDNISTNSRTMLVENEDFLHPAIERFNIAENTDEIYESITTETQNYSEDDLYWLSRIIEAESKGEPMEGKIAVGNVIINRRESPDFPDSIYEVIFEKTSGKYQFTPVKNNTRPM